MAIRKKHVTLRTSRQLSKNAKEVGEQRNIKKVSTDGTSVTACLGTVLSRNYNSCKLEVSVTFPTTKSKAKRTAREAWEFCGRELRSQLEEAERFLSKLR